MRLDHKNHVAVYHGATVYRPNGRPCCGAKPGDLLIETWNIGKASVDLEWNVSKSRVDDPGDHAGQCARWGPDVSEDTLYPPLLSALRSDSDRNQSDGQS